MTSSFNTSLPLAPYATYPTALVWDNVCKYNKFFAQIVADQACTLTVYECNFQEPTLSNSAIYVYNYESLNNCVIIEGGANCKNISFSIQNTSGTQQSTLYFSIVYK